MCVFLKNNVGSLVEWDEYCHYVAGLVGIGLSRIFSASHLESEEVGRDEQLSNSMGLFLQKTNIIRDYLEDIKQGRRFWPKEVACVFVCLCLLTLYILCILLIICAHVCILLYLCLCTYYVQINLTNTKSPINELFVSPYI